MTELSSRERMQRAFRGRDLDHIPCCFMSFAVLKKRLKEDWFEVTRQELAMGLDSTLFIPSASRAARADHPDLRGLPVRFHPEVKAREWREKAAQGFDTRHKEYGTPAGTLTTQVRLSEDWPHGDHIPFIDDYQLPRSNKPLVTGIQDLDALDYLLVRPSDEDAASYLQEARRAHEFAKQQAVILAGGWGVGLDLANWLCGMQNLMVLALEQPEFVDALLERVHIWNMQRMEVVLSGGVDLYIRRAWYEGCDFVTPRFYRKSVLPRLKAEVGLAHNRGAFFGYICSSGAKPMLDFYREAGIDVLLGVDPVEGTHTDMPLMKAKLGGQVCLWGGVSGAVTLERGAPADIRAAVAQAVEILGRERFVLSPIDNITVDDPLTWENISILIDEWKKRR